MADQLSSVFPEIEQEVLAAMLAHHGTVELVVEALLDQSAGGVPDSIGAEVSGADMALQIQIDQEIAQALQQEMNAERQREGTPTSSATCTASAAERVAAVAGGTKRLFQPLLQAVQRVKTTGGGSQRLLDETDSLSNVNQPLPTPTFSSPVQQPYSAPSAPPVAQATTSTRAVARENSVVSESLSTPLTTPQNRYTSRVERARQANRISSASARLPSVSADFERPLPSTLAPLVSPPAAAVLALQQVPVGELI